LTKIKESQEAMKNIHSICEINRI